MSCEDQDRTNARQAPVQPAPSSVPTSLWPGLDDPEHSRWYAERFRAMARDGRDLLGESRLVDALAPRGARLLDAGCGPGRHGGHLSRLGHTVVGVDLDAELVAAAAEDHPDATWLVADLVSLDLGAQGQPGPFDGALLAGNVMDFIPADHQAEALRRVAAHVAPDGFVVIGCRVGRGFTPDDLDAAGPGAGLRLEHRFATWDLRPWAADSDFCVSILRRAGG